MRTGVTHALRLVEKYQITYLPTVYALYKIAYKEGLLVRYFPYKGRIKGSYLMTPDGIGLLTVSSGLTEAYIKNVLAHCLGYHYLHAVPGIHIYGDFETGLDSRVKDFAAILLVPPHSLKSMGKLVAAHEIAQLTGIPYPLACLRIDLANKYVL